VFNVVASVYANVIDNVRTTIATTILISLIKNSEEETSKNYNLQKAKIATTTFLECRESI
jgi:hypothetical protein